MELTKSMLSNNVKNKCFLLYSNVLKIEKLWMIFFFIWHTKIKSPNLAIFVTSTLLPFKKRKKIVSRLFLLVYRWKLVLVVWIIKVFNCQHFCGKNLSKSLLDSFQLNRRKLVLVAGSTIKIRFSACTCSRCSRALL